MILKLNNKSYNFYNYLRKFLGSRVVEITTQDRIYDDNNKVTKSLEEFETKMQNELNNN